MDKETTRQGKSFVGVAIKVVVVGYVAEHGGDAVRFCPWIHHFRTSNWYPLGLDIYHLLLFFSTRDKSILLIFII